MGALEPVGFRARASIVPRYWKPLFGCWVSMIEEYCASQACRDRPYWHSERSNVGLLASAAWMTGRLIALEEYAAARRDDQSKGRADLWIKSGKLSHLYEAKYTWFGGAGSEPHVEQLFRSAVRQLAQIADPYYQERFAVIFCCIHFTARAGDELLPRALDEVRRALRVRHDAVAWCIPMGLRGRAEAPDARLRVQEPGVIALLRSTESRSAR